MQQLTLRFDASSKLNNNNSTMVCQSCLISSFKSAKLCNFCLRFICQQCAQNHDSHNGEVPRISSNNQWTNVSAGLQEFSNNKKPAYQSPDSFTTSTLQFKGLCQRCQLKGGNKTCFSCSNRIFCNNCFNQLHSTEKFVSHKTAQLKKNEVRDNEQVLIWNQKEQILKNNNKQHLLTHSFKLQHKLSGQSQQCDSRNHKEKLQEIRKNIVDLSLLKVSWNENIRKTQRAYDQLFVNIKKELQEKIQELKLKILQIQLKIKLNKDFILQQSKEYFDQIDRAVLNYKNAEFLLQLKKSSIDIQKIAQKILQNLTQKRQILAQKKQEMFNNEVNPKISEQFYADMQLLKQKFNKIQYKKIVAKQEPKNTLLIFNSPKAEKKLPIEFKSDSKPMKKSLNLANCKSQNKMNPLTQSQNNSESNSKSRNSIKNLNQLLPSNAILKSYATTPSQQIGMTTRVGFRKASKQAQKMDLNIKQARSKGALQKSARLSNKISYLDTKSGVNKAFLNIQTTKKMINQLRTQMSEFSICKLNIAESECKTNTGKQNEENEEYLQTISRISIDSLIIDQEKEI